MLIKKNINSINRRLVAQIVVAMVTCPILFDHCLLI